MVAPPPTKTRPPPPSTPNGALLRVGHACIRVLHADCARPRVHRRLVGFQARLESSSRRKSSSDVIADSPYAAGGSGNTTTSKINHASSSNGSSNAAWKHKHTKTLPWGESGVIAVDGGGSGGSGGGCGSCSPDADSGRQEEGFGRQPAGDRFGNEVTEGGRGGKAREGYRLQVHMLVLVCGL